MESMLIADTPTVAQLAITQPGALAVFTKYNIDYCCGGNRTLKEACHRIGLDPEKIQAEIDRTPASPSGVIHPQRWSSSFLADYIVQNHHSFVNRAIPELQNLLEKVCDRHGNDSPELLKIREAFLDLADELTSHMDKEETVLFPAIKEIESKKQDSVTSSRYVDGPIQMMEHEHTLAGDLVKEIRTLSGNYMPPDFACPTFRIAYQRLREFDNDLMQHIHLENNVLFARFKSGHACGL